eukprot:6757341-Prorocentrum_lima.AAC.1
MASHIRNPVRHVPVENDEAVRKVKSIERNSPPEKSPHTVATDIPTLFLSQRRLQGKSSSVVMEVIGIPLQASSKRSRNQARRRRTKGRWLWANDAPAITRQTQCVAEKKA